VAVDFALNAVVFPRVKPAARSAFLFHGHITACPQKPQYLLFSHSHISFPQFGQTPFRSA
jgi:hypothetical protein